MAMGEFIIVAVFILTVRLSKIPAAATITKYERANIIPAYT